MPALVERGASFWLSCRFELEAGDSLYSVKWYRNEEEFYRVIGPLPAQEPATSTATTTTTTTTDTAHNSNNNGNTISSGGQQYFGQMGVNVLVSSAAYEWTRLRVEPT